MTPCPLRVPGEHGAEEEFDVKFRYLPHVLVPLTALVFGASLVVMAEQEQPPALGDAIVFDHSVPPPGARTSAPQATVAPSTNSAPPKAGEPPSTSLPAPRKTTSDPAEVTPTPSPATQSQPRELNQAPEEWNTTTPTASPPTSQSDDDDGSDD